MFEQRIYVELKEETTASSILPHSIEVVCYILQEIKRRYDAQENLNGDYTHFGNKEISVTTVEPSASKNPEIMLLIEGDLVRVIESNPLPFYSTPVEGCVMPVWGCVWGFWNISKINYEACFLGLKKRLLISQWSLKTRLLDLEDSQGFEDFIQTLENLSISKIGEQSIAYALDGFSVYDEDYDYFMLSFPIVVNDQRTQKQLFSAILDLQVSNAYSNHASHQDITQFTFVRGRFVGNKKYYIENLDIFKAKLYETLIEKNELQEHINSALKSYTSNNMLPTLVNEKTLIPDHKNFRFYLPECLER